MSDEHDDKILVTLSSFCKHSAEPRRLLSESGIPFVENQTGKRITPEELLALGTDWTGLIAGVEPYADELMARLPRLRCISRVGSGTDSIDKEAAGRRGVVVRNTPDAPTQAVAEMTLTLALATMRRVPWHHGRMQEGRWEKRSGRLLGGKVVGVVGLGKIGRAVAMLFQRIGCKIIVADLCPPENEWLRANQVGMVSLEELLRTADLVTLHVGGGAETLIGEAELASMKRGACLINTARGHLVDDHAVAAALASGRLGGAGFDVYPEEPYDGPLTKAEGVVMMPHVSTLTEETRVEMEVGAVRNLLLELEGS